MQVSTAAKLWLQQPRRIALSMLAALFCTLVPYHLDNKAAQGKPDIMPETWPHFLLMVDWREGQGKDRERSIRMRTS